MRAKLFVLIIMICITCGKNIFSQTGNRDSKYNRATLESAIDQYLAALTVHDPSKLQLTDKVKFTENGQQLELGDGLWNTISALGTYKLYVADQETGQAAFFGTIFENGVPAIIGLRLKLQENKISEIETFVARSDSGARKLEKLKSPHPVFLKSIPKTFQANRDELIKTANMYFSGLERNDGRGVYPFTDDCMRLENGHQTTSNPTKGLTSFDFQAMNCKEQLESGFFRFITRIRDRRFVAVDTERGLVFSFAFFDHAGNVPTVTLTNGMTIPIGVARPWTWEIAELFKIENGLIRQIEALYQEAPYGMGSGWSTLEKAMSGEIQK